MAVFFASRLVITQGQHQIGAIHPFGVTLAPQAAESDEWHAIVDDQAGDVVDAAQIFVTLAFHGTMDAGDANIMLFVVAYPFVDFLACLSHINGAYAYAQYICQSSPVNVPVIRGNNDPVIRGNDVPPFEWMRIVKVQGFGGMLKDTVSSFAPPPTGFCVPSSGS